MGRRETPCTNGTAPLRPLAVAAALLLAVAPPLTVPVAAAFAPPPRRARPCPSGLGLPRSPPPALPRASSTSLGIIGQDGGILGVGAPEVAVTLIVGYFILGPSELYKLVKEIGKFVQNFRTLGTEAAKSFEGTMENQLELTELRKAQAELNDAFSFRRSINTDAYGAAFDGNNFESNSAAAAGVAGAAAATDDGGTEGAPTKKRRRRLVRRKKKKPVEEIDVPSEEEEALKEYPDLDMLDAIPGGAAPGPVSEEERLRAERLERLTAGGEDPADAASSNEPDWFTASEEDVASAVLDQKNNGLDPALEAYEEQRFQSQLSAESWNAQVMANEDKLSPLSMVMKRLAILEEEKNAADKRLEEEYQKRTDNEDKYYLEKRRVLEDAIVDIQEEAYSQSGEGEKANGGSKEALESDNVTKFSV